MKEKKTASGIDFILPNIDEEEINAVKEVLKTRWLSTGMAVLGLERQFSEYIGTKYALAVNSGTSALELAVKSLTSKGDKVVVPSFTFVATVNAVVTTGRVPVFCDIDETGNIDPDALNKAAPGAKAVIPVHFAGRPCDMDKIMEIAHDHNLRVIEDCAEALGAAYKGKKVGSIGDAGVFSFTVSKNITCGEGGMVTTSQKEVNEKAALMRSHGFSDRRDSLLPGHNFRLSNILAAIAQVQFSKLPKFNLQREKIARIYHNALKTLPIKGIMPIQEKDRISAYQMYWIRVKEDAASHTGGVRDKLVAYLRDRNISAMTYFDPPVHLMKYYRETIPDVSLPSTERFSKEVIELPMHNRLTEEEADKVIEAVRAFFKM